MHGRMALKRAWRKAAVLNALLKTLGPKWKEAAWKQDSIPPY